MATGAGKGGDVYSNAAKAMQGAGGALQGAQNIYNKNTLPGNAATYNPTMASAYSYNPAMTGGAGYGAAQMQGAGYGAAQMGAANAGKADLISQGMDRYMNPYTDSVINRTASDMQRSGRVQTQANNAQAVNAGAFGGGRQGVVDAITNSEVQKNIGDMSGQLRQQGFDTAAGLSAQDVSNEMNMGQFNASLLQQARAGNMDAMNAARAFNAGNTQQARLANQGAVNQAREFGAGNQMTANLANQASRNAAGAFNAGNRQQTSLANAGARNTAGQFNAGAKNAWEQAQSNEALARASGMQSNAAGAQNLGQGLFNMGQTIAGQQGQQGALQQQLIQQIMNSASGQFEGWKNQPTNMLNTLLSSLGMNPMNNSGTTTGKSQNNPGMFDWASLIGQSIFGG